MDQRIEHRLQIKSRAADDLEHVGGGGLLLQRFAQLVEQAGVLDGDDGLRGKIAEEFDLLVGERAHLLAIDSDDAQQLLLLEQRYDQQSPGAGRLGESSLRMIRLRQQIVDMNNALCSGEAAKGSFWMGANHGFPPAQFFIATATP